MKVIKILQTLGGHSMKSEKPCSKAIEAANMVFCLERKDGFPSGIGYSFLNVFTGLARAALNIVALVVKIPTPKMKREQIITDAIPTGT